jgi:spore germination cell wall hydrolase CwlJ-like protein
LIYQTQARAKARAMVGATALGSVMGLTFSGAYFAGSMAQAAVTTAPGYQPTVRAEVERVSAPETFSTPRVEIGSFGSGNGLPALSDLLPATPVEDAASKRQAFGRSYNIAPHAGQPLLPAVEADSSFSLRKSGRELECLTTALYYEARGEGDSGMAAVAQVIVNRARHPDFPKTLCGVIYQGAAKGRGCQFSFACDGSMKRRPEGALWDRARQIAERAMEGRVSQAVGTSTFFHATRISPNWRGLQRVATVGRHVFYRHAGFRGSGANFIRGQVGDFDGFEMAAVETPKPRLYKVAAVEPKTERATRTVQATFKSESETAAPALYKIARTAETAIPAESVAIEAVSLDTLVDTAVAADASAS